MKKYFVSGAIAVAMTAVLATVALAAGEAPAADYSKALVIAICVFTAGLTMAAGTIATGLAMGNGLNGATTAVGRNPEAQGKIMLVMMVGLAMIESLAIYALVIALVILYANPLLKYIFG
ncbi:MAG: ATP synthase F0 subunit C [Smithellaceae bacterium]|nr:ATP synthase F0 subunit C [Smithellaceae bacterium]